MGKLPQGIIDFIETECYYIDFEDEDYVPLEDIPSDLYSYIVEKMLFPSFAEFNSCNSVSAKMCKSLPSVVKLPISVESIMLLAVTSGFSLEAVFDALPKNVTFECERFYIEQDNWEFIKNFSVMADEVYICGESAPIKEFVEEVIQVTKPVTLRCDSFRMPMLMLPEVQKLPSLSILNPETDFNILKLKNPSISIEFDEDSYWSYWLPKEFFMQWVRREREIEEFSLRLDMCKWDWLQEWIKEIEEEVEVVKLSNDFEIYDPFWICRSKDHSDCLSVQFDDYEDLEADCGSICPKSEKYEEKQ